MKFEVEKINGSEVQIKILYNFLNKRTYKISHQSMTAFEDHKNFVLSKPYRAWFILKNNRDYVGNIYIQEDNSIGLNLTLNDPEAVKWCINYVTENYVPRPKINSKVSQFFYINVAFANENLISILQKLKCIPLQVSYLIPNNFDRNLKD